MRKKAGPAEDVLTQKRNRASEHDGLKLKLLRMQVSAGVRSLDEGEYDDVAAADLESYLEGLTVEPANCAH